MPPSEWKGEGDMFNVPLPIDDEYCDVYEAEMEDLGHDEQEVNELDEIDEIDDFYEDDD